MKSLKIMLGAVCALAFSTSPLFAETINDKCPVSGKSVDEDHTVAVAVEFCCEKCKAKFDKEPAEYLEKVATAEEGKCPVSGKSVDEDQTSTISVGVCCEKCEPKVKDDPKAYIAKVKAKGEEAKEKE